MSNEKKTSGSGRKMRKSSLVALCVLIVIAIAVIISALSNNPAKNYSEAAELMENGRYAEAEAAFTALGEYEDSADMAARCRREIMLAEYLTGYERVELGSYEQDNDTADGKEAIEWIVLAEEDGKMLVTSLYALDASSFHDALEVKIAWSNSSLRTWLNSDFMNEAFTAEEQERILDTELKNNGGSEEKGASDDDTTDKIFILSADELELYFAEEGDRELIASLYAEAQGAMVSKNNGMTSWWLRAPREIGNHQPLVNNRGAVITKDANGDGGSIRPAMWITAE